MTFKFPSTESLAKTNLDEYHLNNHHLLNHYHKNADSDDASQILSDYTSNSNTNTNSGRSSNGYYSFANISDNTTESPGYNFKSGVSGALGGTGDAGGNLATHESLVRKSDQQTTPKLEPMELHTDGSSPGSMSPMEAIPENAFTSVSTIFASIPTADNYSYHISSSVSSTKSIRNRKPSSVRRDPISKLQNIPPITQINTASSIETDSVKSKPASRLKRSKAIRCRGGLLQYFIYLGLKIKKHLRKVIQAIHRKLFQSKKHNNGSRNSSSSSKYIPKKRNLNSNKSKSKSKYNKMASRSSSTANLTTSHLKRTQRYVNNLQREMSNKSLKPVLLDEDSTRKVSKKETMTKKITPTAKEIGRNPTTSLRRTNSSIKRAASVIRTRTDDPRQISTLPYNRHSTDKNAENTKVSSTEDKKRETGGLPRSVASKSLSSLARQPSIVVKNKVIPLSIHPYAIEEEEEGNSVGDDDEYVISTNEMRPVSARSSCSSAEDFFEDAEDLEETEGIAFTEDSRNVLAEAFKHYLSSVISQRIMLRLQIAKHQETGANSSYVDLMESIIREYEAPSTSSSLTPSVRDLTPCNKIQDDITNSKPQQEFSITSPFGKNGSRLKHSNSMISLSAQTVKRSLTLPIGIKV